MNNYLLILCSGAFCKGAFFILTESRAWIKSAFTVDNGFPVIKMVNVSSFSEAIRLPNQDFLVSSGEDSGVGLYTGSISTIHTKRNLLL